MAQVGQGISTRTMLALVRGGPRHGIGEGTRIGRQIVVGTGKSSDGHKSFRLHCSDCGREQNIAKWRLIEARLREPLAIDCSCSVPPGQPVNAARRRNMHGDPVASLQRVYQASAKARKLTFTLTLEDFAALIKRPCFYCGSPPANSMGKRLTYSGLDRVDSKLGYARANVVPCCKFCNYAKGRRSQAEFIAWLMQAAARIATAHTDPER